MRSVPSPLEIHIHLCDSNIARFVQCDPQISCRLLDRIQPDKVFTQRQLILADDNSVTVYPCSAVARIDFVMEGFPGWPFHRNVIDVMEITEKEFKARYDPRNSRTERPFQPGEIVCVFGEMELDNGERIFREVWIQVPRADLESERLPMDRNIFFQQLCLAPNLYVRRRGGGAILINPEHLVRMTFYPGPADMPANAWNVQPAGHLWQHA